MVEWTLKLDQFSNEPPGERSSSGCGSCGSGQAEGDGARCGNGLEKIYPTTAIRFGYMRYIGEFTHSRDTKFTCGAKVIIQTQRGIEIGEQVSLTCGGCDKSVTREEIKEWVARSGEDTYMFNAGRILREATAADLAEFSHIQQDCREKRVFADQAARRHDLPLRVAECECTFGGERIIFYFTAAERVDFRDMVKDLAKQYRTRIEMRQIGARDEARLLADYETCGREVCCKVFLKTLKPVSMRMAKLQKATLDPSQVSGRCGRLKCCLRYEHISYEEMDKTLPRNGTHVYTKEGEGVIVNRQVLTQLLQIRTDSDKIVTVAVEDLLDKDSFAESVAASSLSGVGAPEVSPKPPRPRTRPPRGRDPAEPAAKPRPRRQDPERTGSSEGQADASGAEGAEKEPESGRPRRRRRRRRGRGKGRSDGAGGEGGSSPPPTS